MTRTSFHRIALLAASVLSCAAPTPSDNEVVRAYRQFGWGNCDAVRAQVQAIDFSGDGAKREPFFRLLEDYCVELDGDTAAAKQLYSSVIAKAPGTRQAFEAALRLRDLERLDREGLTRSEREEQVRRARKSSRYRHSVRPIQRTEPRYPSAIVAARIKGWVLVDFEIASDGSIADPVVLDSSPPFIFDGAALAAVRQWTYEASNESEPIHATVKLQFDINP